VAPTAGSAGARARGRGRPVQFGLVWHQSDWALRCATSSGR
jgi:hypothetical protein